MQTPSNVNPEWLSGQAQRVWSMLDDMATNDPAAYRKFIDKQLKDGREQVAPPGSSMCVETLILKPKKSRIFINFCPWNKIPAPKTPDDAVPVIGGEMQQIKDDDGKCSIMNLGFNPKILEEYGKNSKNSFDTDTLINLAMDYTEDQQKIKLRRTYTIHEFDQKGDSSLIVRSFRRKGDKDTETDLENLEKNFGHLATESSDSVLGNLANIAGSSQSGVPSGRRSGKQEGEGLLDLKLPNGMENTVKEKKGLIEEIGSESNSGDALKTPDYELEVYEEEDGSETVYLDVFLPGVTSTADSELEVSEDDVHLLIPGQYELLVGLEVKVKDEEVKARFCKKTSCLTITIPVVPEQ